MEPFAWVGPRLRAAVLGVVIAYEGMLALPWPLHVNKKWLRDPENGAQVQAWFDVVAPLGWFASRQDLDGVLDLWTGRIQSIKPVLVAPGRPFTHLTGTGQGWMLFGQGTRFPRAVFVEKRVGDAWVVVFQATHPGSTAFDRAMLYRRSRAAWDGRGTSRGYKSLRRWAAKLTFHEHPDAVEVRVGLETLHSTLPGAPRPASRRTAVATFTPEAVGVLR